MFARARRTLTSELIHIDEVRLDACVSESELCRADVSSFGVRSVGRPGVARSREQWSSEVSVRKRRQGPGLGQAWHCIGVALACYIGTNL